VLGTGDEGIVHPASRLFGHSKGAIDQTASDVLGCRAKACDLVIVNCRRAVHREVRHHSPIDEIDDQRSEAGLDDVSAEHGDHRAFRACGLGDRGGDAHEIARDENFGKRREKCREAAVLAGRGSEFGGGNLVRPPLDGDGPNLREVCFGVNRCGSLTGRLAGTVLPCRTAAFTA
jgi:hypothetical protein